MKEGGGGKSQCDFQLSGVGDWRVAVSAAETGGHGGGCEPLPPEVTAALTSDPTDGPKWEEEVSPVLHTSLLKTGG